MTGLLLLPVKQEMGSFYKNGFRGALSFFGLVRIIQPCPWFIQFAGGSAQLVTVFFPWGGEPSASLMDALKAIALIPVNFNMFACPMWYIYLLIGLYLYMPVFSAWIEKASDRSKRLFLGLWCNAYPALCTGVCISLCAGYLRLESIRHAVLFCGFNGYLLLGHYLKKGNDWSWTKTLLITVPMFAAGYFVTFKGFRTMSSNPDVTNCRTGAFLDLLFA
jgi:hypothetical protein